MISAWLARQEARLYRAKYDVYAITKTSSLQSRVQIDILAVCPSISHNNLTSMEIWSNHFAVSMWPQTLGLSIEKPDIAGERVIVPAWCWLWRLSATSHPHILSPQQSDKLYEISNNKNHLWQQETDWEESQSLSSNNCHCVMLQPAKIWNNKHANTWDKYKRTFAYKYYLVWPEHKSLN